MIKNQNFINDEKLQEKYDYIVYNDFNNDSRNKLMNLIERIIDK